MRLLRRARLALPCACALAVVLVSCAAAATPTQVLDHTDALLAWPKHGVTTLEYHGHLRLEGHFTHPHETRTYETLRRVFIAPPDRIRQDFSTWVTGDTVLSVETTLLLGDHVIKRDDEHAPWLELHGRDAAMAARAVRSVTPALVLADARRHLARVQLTSAKGTQKLAWPDTTGRMWTLRVDEASGLPLGHESMIANDWEGDIGDSTVYGHGRASAGMWAAATLHTRTHEADSGWWLDEELADLTWHEGATNAYENVTAPLRSEVIEAPEPARPDTIPHLVLLAPHTWAIELRDADTRSLVMEFADHLIVLDASAGSRQGEAILATIRAQLPKKPVRLVAFSHYHPDYTGGLRPFLADSVKVLCAPGNAGYVREIAARRFVQQPDRLERRSHGTWAPQLELLGAPIWTHADSLNELRVLDIGARSHHTDSYLVFLLPRAGILFEGDLGFFKRDGKLVASRRASGLVEALEASGVPVTRVIQGWPVNGNAAEIKYPELRSLVAPQQP